ncbi:MAG: hypothetical protein IKJ55_05690 [Clostridia bacterium]|nr:hypothetical protein [Clostridia bacterium]
MSVINGDAVEKTAQYKGFGGNLLYSILKPFPILMLVAAVAVFVLCGVVAGICMALLLCLRVFGMAFLLTKAEKRLQSKHMPIDSIRAKTDCEYRFHKLIYIISAVLLVILGGLFGWGIWAKGFDMTYIGAGICFLLAVSPMEILPYYTLCKLQNFAELSAFGTSEWQNGQEIYDAKRIVIRPEDVVADKLNFASITTYYKSFVPGESITERDKPICRTILEMAMLAAEVTTDENGMYQGDKQEIAWLDGAAKHNVYKETVDAQCAEKTIRTQDGQTEICVQIPGGVRIVSKGDAEKVLASCDRVLGDGIVMPASETVCADILRRAEQYTQAGDFVCALAFSEDSEDVEWAKDKMFLGLLVCRYEAESSNISLIEKYRETGLKPLLLSPENTYKTKAIMQLYGVDKGACADGEAYTDGSADAYCNITPDREKEIVKTVGNVLIFVQDSENVHLKDCASAVVDITADTENAGKIGRLTYKSDIVSLRKTLARTLRNRRKLGIFWLIAKGAILFATLLWGIWQKAVPFNYYQMLCLFGLLMPVCAQQILAGDYDGERYAVNEKQKKSLIALFGALTVITVSVALIFGRFTVPARSLEAAELFASGMGFLVAYGCIVLLAMQTLSHKILLRFAFVTKKKAVITLGISVLLAAIVLWLQPVRQLFAIPYIPYHKGLWIWAFLAAFLLASDLIKFILYTVEEKE